MGRSTAEDVNAEYANPGVQVQKMRIDGKMVQRSILMMGYIAGAEEDAPSLLFVERDGPRCLPALASMKRTDQSRFRPRG
jgi:hypothetical protein